MLIGGGDISNAVTTLGTCFSMFVYLPVRFRFALIGGNLTAQSTGSHRGIGGGIRISETQLQVLLPQLARAPRVRRQTEAVDTHHWFHNRFL